MTNPHHRCACGQPAEHWRTLQWNLHNIPILSIQLPLCQPHTTLIDSYYGQQIPVTATLNPTEPAWGPPAGDDNSLT